MDQEDDFVSYLQAADELIARASREELADVARLLALNIGYYHAKYGDVPQEKLLQMTRAETLNEDGQRMLLHGMQNLVSVLATVMNLIEDDLPEGRH